MQSLCLAEPCAGSGALLGRSPPLSYNGAARFGGGLVSAPMAQDNNSFDIVSTVDLQEVRNAVSQAEKEVGNRYDLKKAAAELELSGEEMTAGAADEYSLGQALDVLKSKLVRRGVNLKSLRYGKIEPASGGRVRQKRSQHVGVHPGTVGRVAAGRKTRRLEVEAAING